MLLYVAADMLPQNLIYLDMFSYFMTWMYGPAVEYNYGHVFVLRMWIGYSIDSSALFLLKFKNQVPLEKYTIGYFMYISLSLTFFTIFVPGHLESDVHLLLLLAYFKATSTLTAAILYRFSKETKERNRFNVLCVWASCFDLSINFAQSIVSYVLLLLVTFSNDERTTVNSQIMS